MKRRTRVRFAPSPTGPLHMGGVRTALYNYLYAKQNDGDFIVRIEDTDSSRFVEGAEEYIIEALRWCGINPDEGIDSEGKVVELASAKHPHAPYRQSQRRPLYKKYAEELVEKGFAYYAFDTAEQLQAKRQEAESKKENFIYNSQTRLGLHNSLSLSEQEVSRLLYERNDWTIRFKMPEDEIVEMDDLVRGHIEVNTSTLDDKVLWKKADELPTYHLANIVDDHLMEISEVIRGEEWLPSLPLHYLLYKAFGWTDTMPHFAHLSLLLKPDGKGKLSKRDGDKLGFPVFPLSWTNTEGEISRGYREDGYFPEAFVNLLAMLGWNPGDDTELFTIKELVKKFSLDRIVKAGSRFNPEKAHWYNKEYLRSYNNDWLTEQFIPILEKKGLNSVSCPVNSLTIGASFNSQGADFKKNIYTFDYIEKVIELVKERITFLSDVLLIGCSLFVSPKDFEKFGLKAVAKIDHKPADPRKAVDPRAKVYDDSLTFPFLAKDVEKFWKEENYCKLIEVSDFLNNYAKDLVLENLQNDLEEFIRSKEWNMGKIMNSLRLALTGSSSGLGIADIIFLIGKEEAIERLAFAQERLSN